MDSVPPTPFSTQPMSQHPSASGSRPRGSINTSFSYDPQALVDTLRIANLSSTSQYNRSTALDPNRSVLQTSPQYSPRRRRKLKENTTGTASRHPLANATSNADVFNENAGGGDADDEVVDHWTMVDRMRLWRHDAMMQHMYATAGFWGDKVLSWTNDPNDAFWLAQTYFHTHQYTRAETLLTRPFPMAVPTSPQSQNHQVNGHGPTSFVNIKGKGKEIIDDPIDPVAHRRLPMGPSAMIDIAAEHREGVSRLVDMSVACRSLAAQCQMQQGKWSEATEMLGEANPFRESGESGPGVRNIDEGLKVEAVMCHLRGLLMVKVGRMDQAKNCFVEALALDVKCYDAFEQLMNGEMMTPDEEWEFVQGLAYKEQTPDDAEFVRLIYTARLRKYKHIEEQALVRRRLVEEFGLSDNPDVLFSFADALYAQFRWADCFAITSRILDLVKVHAPTMPLHIACMHHLSHLRPSLFILAHELVDKEPENPLSWYAVGVWYLAAAKWGEARSYFSKTSLMDPRFGPAWVAFAHTFAYEGEHDHAVTAYSTCARLFTGSHLPLMFVGMEHIMLSNYDLADEALNAAYSMCDGDPLLANERGVMAYNRGHFDRAVDLFNAALSLAQVTQTSQDVWTASYMNLGTCYRKLGRLEEAKATYERVIEIDSRSATAYVFLGLVHQLMDNTDLAIVKYHEALSIDSMNAYALELLNLALECNADVHGPFGRKKFPQDEDAWAKRMHEQREKSKQTDVLALRPGTPRPIDEDMSIG